jgi:hypothetical protein
MLELSANVNCFDQVLALMEQSTRPLAVTSQSRGGLILVNQHYSDLIGPGSRLIWPRHFHCTGVYPVGTVELCELPSSQARQRSLHNRINGLSVLSRILQDFDPLRRACLLVNLLCQRWGLGTVKQANLSLLSGLGRIQPNQMQEAISLYEQHLRQLGQAERLGDKHLLAWQRQLVGSASELPLEGLEDSELIPALDFGVVEDLVVEDRAVEDGALEDGALADGALEGVGVEPSSQDSQYAIAS